MFSNINVTDFQEKDRDLVQQLSYHINPAIRTLDEQMNGSVDFSKNIKCDIIEIPDVDSTTTSLKVKLKKVTKVTGVILISLYNKTETNGNVSSAPYIQWVKGDDNNIVVEKILGLKDKCKYTAVILVI